MRSDDLRRQDWNSHIRGGWVILWLWQGSKLSTRDIARLTGITKQGAQWMMDVLSDEFPIICFEGKWQWMEKEIKTGK